MPELPYHLLVASYWSFDDDRFATLKIDDLNDVLTVIYRIYGTEVKYMFFDEIQNVDGWHLFVNRLLRQGHRIVLTGSNAKLLSGELVTHLTGRYNKIELYPFSYADVCRQSNVESMPLTTKGIATRQKKIAYGRISSLVGSGKSLTRFVLNHTLCGKHSISGTLKLGFF